MDDLIRRQDVLALSKDVTLKNGAKHRCVDTTEINLLPSVHQWIPCSERMPNPNEIDGNVIKYYLVQNVFGDMLVCDWNGKEWRLIYSYESEMPEDVVAWMPLPKPYEAERKEE